VGVVEEITAVVRVVVEDVRDVAAAVV
jgi:hypothetical protein